MNTIASLTRSDPAQAEAITKNLTDLFRMNLNDVRNRISLGEELKLYRRYLYIEALRLGERLEVRWDVDALPTDALIPPLTLQPLLENAVYHGIEPATAGGRIEISGRLDGADVDIRITNPAPESATQRPNGNRLALDNTRERLAACFGPGTRVSIEAEGVLYRVGVRFPYLTRDNHPDRPA